MKIKHLILSLLLFSAFLLASCNAQATTGESMPEEKMMSESDAEAMEAKTVLDEPMADDEMTMQESNEADQEGEAMDGEMMEEKDEAMKDDSMAEEGMMAPEWYNAVLTDAKTGETFSITDLKGKVVLVETLAMWCSNCFKQQGQVAALHELLGERDDFISLGIDIDPNENAEALKIYTEQNGFDWLYTVAPVEVAREIGQLYGEQYLNPPSTPMLIIDRDGEVHLLPFGIKSAESLLATLEPFLEG
jgi:thiol-disulfide isomerase/thioredoxin